MNLSRLVRADKFEVMEWLVRDLNLTREQRQKLMISDAIRLSPFEFYKLKERTPVSFWWRMSLLLIPFYMLFILLYKPFHFLITGKWAFNREFERFHYGWMRKIRICL